MSNWISSTLNVIHTRQLWGGQTRITYSQKELLSEARTQLNGLKTFLIPSHREYQRYFELLFGCHQTTQLMGKIWPLGGSKRKIYNISIFVNFMKKLHVYLQLVKSLQSDCRFFFFFFPLQKHTWNSFSRRKEYFCVNIPWVYNFFIMMPLLISVFGWHEQLLIIKLYWLNQ